MNLSVADFRLDRLCAALRSRRSSLEAELARFDYSGALDRFGRLPFARTGTDRARLQEELRQVTDWLAIASDPTEG